MSWQVTVKLPNDANTVGHVSAVWTDPDATLGVFSYSRTARATQKSANAFIVEAIAARDAWRVSQAANDVKSVWVLDRLNTADPEVI